MLNRVEQGASLATALAVVRHLHAHPELPAEDYAIAAAVAARLDRCGYRVREGRAAPGWSGS